MDYIIPILLQLVFWLSIAAILHTYGFYPFILSKIGAKASEESPLIGEPEQWPEVYVVMAMYNEASVIEATLQSIVESDYPKDRLNILIGSDNSSDGSDEIVRKLAETHSNIKLEVFGGRCGKIKIINELIETIPTEGESLLLLCDANVIWSQSLAKNFARHFTDEKVGIVASCVIDSEENCDGIAAEEESYVNMENAVKFAEGKLWGRMMGAFGACYALRRSVYEPVPAAFNVDDFYQTIACYEQGYNGIVDLEAVCYEAVSEDITEEFRRKKRISKGNFQNLKRFSNYLQPWNCGWPTFFAFWSHKGLRWFGPLLLISIFTTSLLLGLQGYWIYVAAFTGMVGSFALVAADSVMESLGTKRLRILKFIRYFYTMNVALLMGGIEFCKGVNNSVWEPTKRVPIQNSKVAAPASKKS